VREQVHVNCSCQCFERPERSRKLHQGDGSDLRLYLDYGLNYRCAHLDPSFAGVFLSFRQGSIPRFHNFLGQSRLFARIVVLLDR